MNPQLTALEIRVIGCLVEKQITTPEQYPLSLNALTNACNQKSNRDPVLQLDEAAVQQVVDDLIKKRLVSEQSGYGNRVPKYQHLFCNTNFGTLQFSAQELAIVCELFLRGAQTPGELRSRASRMCGFADVSEVESTLEALAARADGPYVQRLARQPGRRESRYLHLFGAEPGDLAEGAAADASPAPASAAAATEERIDRVERRLAELEAELAQLKLRLDGGAGG